MDPSAEMALPPVAWVNCSLFTVIAGLVLDGLVASTRSLAVTAKQPLVLKARLKVCEPATRGALEGRVTVVSLAVMPTVSLTVLTRFQLASTALTVTLKL